MCGKNPQCSTQLEIQTLQLNGNDVNPCIEKNCNAGADRVNDDHLYCGCFFDGRDGMCKIQRSDQEVCAPISKFYNPLYIHNQQNIDAGLAGSPVCDDIIGGHIGEYHCMGSVIYIFLFYRKISRIIIFVFLIFLSYY